MPTIPAYLYEQWCDEHGYDYDDPTGELWDRCTIEMHALLEDRGA